jgi:hypothetical protein
MNEMIQQLLLQRLGAPEGAAGPDLPDLFAQLGGDDPRYSAIAQALAGRRAAAQEASGDDDPDQEDGVITVDPTAEEREAAVRRLQRMAADMHAELRFLRAHNDSAAAALGACYLCWGKDARCPVCLGTGHPGAFMPDKELFRMLVLPAVRRVREALKHDGQERSAGRSQSPNGSHGSNERSAT